MGIMIIKGIKFTNLKQRLLLNIRVNPTHHHETERIERRFKGRKILFSSSLKEIKEKCNRDIVEISLWRKVHTLFY